MQILFATDGSDGALSTAQLLNALRLTGQDRILVLTASAAEEKAAASGRLERTRAALEGNPACRTEAIVCGPAAEVILRRAAELKPDLIALGSRGLNAVARFLLGSVAERVACHAACPVLVARPLNGQLDRVVAGIDGSNTAMEAARFLRELPLPPHCEIRLATALPFLQSGVTSAGRIPSLAAELHALQVTERREAKTRLEELAVVFREAGRPISTEFRQRHPAAGLLEIADEQEADLIVIGRQGLSRVDRFFMGSVSMNLLRHAACSVLVVPELRGTQPGSGNPAEDNSSWEGPDPPR